MIKYPRSMMYDKGVKLYRGVGDDSLTDGRWSWWATDEQYASRYGDEVLCGILPPHSDILDITGDDVIEADGDISGKSLDSVLPGLANACGLDSDATIECDRLWDCMGDDHSNLCDLLENSGFAGIKMLIEDRREAYLLINE